MTHAWIVPNTPEITFTQDATSFTYSGSYLAAAVKWSQSLDSLPETYFEFTIDEIFSKNISPRRAVNQNCKLSFGIFLINFLGLFAVDTLDSNPEDAFFGGCPLPWAIMNYLGQ